MITQVERLCILDALNRTGGSIVQTARILSVTPESLQRWLRRHNMPGPYTRVQLQLPDSLLPLARERLAGEIQQAILQASREANDSPDARSQRRENRALIASRVVAPQLDTLADELANSNAAIAKSGMPEQLRELARQLYAASEA